MNWTVSVLKSIVRSALAVVLIWAASAPPAQAQSLKTRAPIAFLFEPSSSTTLFAKNAEQAFQPGSLAKIMVAATVFKAFDLGDALPETLCKVSEHAWRTGGAPAGGATMFAAIKSDIPVEDLLKGLLIHNANDAAIVLAECLEGSENAFAQRMNALAKEIGMTGSTFVNPAGFEVPGARTTARDMARLAAYILKDHARNYTLFAQPDFTWNKIFQRNKNPLLGEIRQLDGLGAGFSEADGYAGLASVLRNDRRVIAVVAGLKSHKNRLTAMKEVIEGAWEYFTVERLFDKGHVIATARVFGGTQSSVPLVASKHVDVLLPRGGTLDYRLRVVYSGPLRAPVESGVETGELRVIGEDGIVYRTVLVTGGVVEQGSMQVRALSSLQNILFGWF